MCRRLPCMSGWQMSGPPSPTWQPSWVSLRSPYRCGTPCTGSRCFNACCTSLVRGQIDIVMTTLKDPVPAAGAAAHDKWATSLGNVVAASRLAQAIGSVPRPRPINLHLSREHPAPREDLVLLGGINENALSAEFIRSLELNVPDVNFVWDDRDEDANVLCLGHTGRPPATRRGLPLGDGGSRERASLRLRRNRSLGQPRSRLRSVGLCCALGLSLPGLLRRRRCCSTRLPEGTTGKCARVS